MDLVPYHLLNTAKFHDSSSVFLSYVWLEQEYFQTPFVCETAIKYSVIPFVNWGEYIGEFMQ